MKSKFEGCLIDILVKENYLKLDTGQQTAVIRPTDPDEDNLRTGLEISTVKLNKEGIEQRFPI